MIFGRNINKYYKKYWYLFFLGFLFLASVDIVQLFIPDIVGRMIAALGDDFDGFATVKLSFVDGWFSFNLGYVLLSVGLISLFIVIGRIGWRIALWTIARNVECDLRKEMFDHVERLSVSWYSKEKVGGLMAYFTNDLEDIKGCFERGLLFLADIIFLGIGAIVFMFMTHWALALICMVPIIALGVSMYLVMKYETVLWDRVDSAFQGLSDMTQESITGLSVVKAFVREGREMKRFSDLNGQTRLSNIKAYRFSQLFGNCWVNILIYSTIVVILLVGGYFAVAPDIVIPGISATAMSTPAQAAGTMASFLGYFDSLIWPLQAISMLIELISRGKAALNRIDRLMDSPIEVKDSKDLRNNVKVMGSITFKDFSFAYPDTPKLNVLSGISFHVEPGESLGIVGRTGAGKSSLAVSLLKLYNIDRGMLEIDGVDINDWYGKCLRDSIGFVSQDAFLFSDTIKGNLIYGRDDATMDDIRNACVFADVDSNILELKDGYETVVGERGKTLSGGQRQRISMARSVLRNPSILVLDDSVSAVDALTEKKILENIKEEGRRTTLVISSRLSAVENLDHILVLDQGRMVGFGTHEELLRGCPVYQKLYELQRLQGEMA